MKALSTFLPLPATFPSCVVEINHDMLSRNLRFVVGLERVKFMVCGFTEQRLSTLVFFRVPNFRLVELEGHEKTDLSVTDPLSRSQLCVPLAFVYLI